MAKEFDKSVENGDLYMKTSVLNAAEVYRAIDALIKYVSYNKKEEIK